MRSKSSRVRSANGAALRISSKRSSSRQFSAAHSATICCARMSSGSTGGCTASSAPLRTPASSAVHSTSSSRVIGYRRPFGVPPRLCPERPTRCRKVAMLRGEAIWQTISIGPMSMPSSSDAVATSARSSPARSCDSTRCRRSFDRLPWCAATASSPSRSASRCATRSAMRRVLTKTSVVRCALHVRGDGVEHLAELLARCHRLELSRRQLDADVERAPVADVDDGAARAAVRRCSAPAPLRPAAARPSRWDAASPTVRCGPGAARRAARDARA